MNSRRRYKIVPLLMAFIILFTTACGTKKEEVEEEVIKPVRVSKVKLEEHSRDLEISGNVKPAQLVKVAFKVPGLIESANIEEGDKVSKGQLLMSLNTHDYEIGLMAAQAQYNSLQLEMDSKIGSAVDQAEANLEFVNTQLDRVRRLHEKGAVSNKTLEELELQKTVIEKKRQEALDARITSISQLEQAQSLIDLANSKIEDTKLHSPISGTVVKKLSEAGETVIPGYPTLVLGRLNQLEVEIGVPDRMIGKIEKGKKVKVSIKGLDREIEGTISKIDPAADLETRTFPVKITIDNKDEKIKPGMIASVKINMEKTSSIAVPIDAVIDNAEGTFLFVHNGEGRVARKAVKTGEVFGDLIEIVEGIESGEEVVVEGQYRLNDGEKVNLVDKSRGEEND